MLDIIGWGEVYVQIVLLCGLSLLVCKAIQHVLEFLSAVH